MLLGSSREPPAEHWTFFGCNDSINNWPATQWPQSQLLGRRAVRVLSVLTLLLLSGGLAAASDRDILNALENGTIKPQTKIAVPSGSQSMPMPGSENLPSAFMANLTKAQESNIVDKAYPLMEAKWPYNQVAVCWENPDATNNEERSWVQNAVEQSWQKSSALKFRGWQTCLSDTQGIRIYIDDAGPYTKYLGKFLSGVKSGMVLNFTFQTWSEPCAASEAKRKSCIESIAVHEFGHAIGFAHEQNRPDTSGECGNLWQGPNGDRIDITPWDPESVMNYCNPVYNNNGVLSKFDIQAVQYIYGAPS
jgi:hypothetical protein